MVDADLSSPPGQVDPITGDLIVLQHAHDEIHAGKHFISSDVVKGLGAGATQLYLLTAPNTAKRIHMLIVISSAPGSTITIFEAPTVTANGAAMTAINNERNSANTATLLVFKSPTVTVNGTQLDIEEIGSGSTAGKFSGATSNDRNENEFVLKQNTKYLIQEVALAASTDITTKFIWYEE